MVPIQTLSQFLKSSVYKNVYFTSTSQQLERKGFFFLLMMSILDNDVFLIDTLTALQGGTITSPSQNASVPFEIPLAALAGPIIAGERHF